MTTPVPPDRAEGDAGHVNDHHSVNAVLRELQAGVPISAHAASHQSGGVDQLDLGSLAGSLPTSQVTGLNTALGGKQPLIPTPSKAGRWVTGVQGNFTSSVMVADLLVGLLYPVTVAHTLDRIGITTQASGSANSVIRLGIYKADANGVDYTKVLDAGTIDGTQAAGNYSITISQALTPGLYLLVAVGQGSPTTQPSVYKTILSGGIGNLLTAVSHNSIIDGAVGLSLASVTGALPASITPARYASPVAIVVGRLA